MQKNKKPAFTLTEIMLAVVIIGIVAACLARSVMNNNYDEKGNTLMAFKAIETISSISSQIRQTETEVLPTGKFLVKAADGTYKFAVLSTKADTKEADAEEVAELFGVYMKKDGDVIDFCSVSGACSDTSIKGFRLPGNLYLGFEKYGEIKNCPDFYMPDDKSQSLSASVDFDGATRQCWGSVHIDTNGAKGPNILNEDYYVFGMDENGIVTAGKIEKENE